jgi:hypothetical protein
MTKAFLLAGLAGALALTTLPALAQAPSGPDDRDGYLDRGGRDQGSWRDGPWRGGGRGGWRDMGRGDGGEMRDGWHGGPHRGRGARFMVRSGDAAVAVRCDANESMRTCLDATLTLLERARGLSSGGAGGSAGSGSGPGPGPAPSQPRQ